jgi:hypothetical protein
MDDPVVLSSHLGLYTVNSTKLLLERVSSLVALMVLWLLVLASSRASAFSADLELALEARLFAHDGIADQENFGNSAAFRGEFVFATGESSQLVVTPFVRVDSEDEHRTHADVRELFWSVVGERWEFSLGAKQVFWGVTEFNHLVDIINQTDLVENIDAEDKLGQPMAHLAFNRDFGVVDLFLMSGFRERTFPGEDGRLRLPFEIDEGHARYESDDKRSHVDVAVRWSHQIGGLDVGLYHFNGTARAPSFALEARPGALPELVPVYATIDQTGLDAQYLAGNWAFKLESIRRSGDGETFHAVTGGVEYTVVGVFGSSVDLGLVAEYFHDERGEAAYDTLFEDDYAVGLRVGFNDADDSQALVGVIRDADSGETVISVEASRRIGENFSLSVEGRVFTGAEDLEETDPSSWIPDRDNRAAFLEKEDYVQLEFKWHF